MIDNFGIPFLMGHAPLRTRAVKERSRTIGALSNAYFRLLVLKIDYEQRELMAEGRIQAYWQKRCQEVSERLYEVKAALGKAQMTCHKEAA